MLALAFGLAGMARPGQAQPAAGDSTAIEADEVDVSSAGDGPARGVAARDTTRRARGTAAVPRFERPRWVMLRSLAVPGWGQLHNGSWIKAVGVAAGEAWLGYQVIDDQRKLSDLSAAVDRARAANNDALQEQLVSEYNARLDHSVSRQWLLGGVVAYALLDAYIDAHFRNFKMDFEIDPALPDGPSESGVRVSLRGNF